MSSALFSCNDNLNNYTFEAEGAALKDCRVEKVDSDSTNISDNSCVSYIQKGSQIAFGIKSSDTCEATLSLVLSCPLSWDNGIDGPVPVSFTFSDIYYLNLNGDDITPKGVSLSPVEDTVKPYNYYSMVEISFKGEFNTGDNELFITCIKASNNSGSSYASIGNIDCLKVTCKSKLDLYKPVLKDEKASDFVMSTDRDKYYIGEEINVHYKRRLGHTTDWIGLFAYDSPVTDGAICSYTLISAEETFDISSKIVDTKAVLKSGYYKICYLADDGYEVLKEIDIRIIDKDAENLMHIAKETYSSGEAILITSKQREGHTKDWIALYRAKDTIGQIGSIYYYYPTIYESEVDIVGKNLNTTRKDVDLTVGDYKLCYLADDKYEVLQEIFIKIV